MINRGSAVTKGKLPSRTNNNWIIVLHLFSSVLERKGCIMSAKHVASGNAGATNPKKCRKSITLETKLEILKKSDEGMRLKDKRSDDGVHSVLMMPLNMWPMSGSEGWILRKKHCATFMGSVGKDEFSKTLEQKAEEAGVKVRYQHQDDHPTGTCAVVITKNGACRSLVANLAAANHFTKSHLDIPENRALLEKAKFYYISGFFLTVSPESILTVGQHACDENKVFSMNLSAPFLCEFYKEPMMKAFPYIDILFSNETEAAKFSEVQGFDLTDIREIALKTASLPKKNTKRSRTVIFTQGAENVIMAKDGKVREFPVIRLPDEKLIDTNGAGDAFVGGFLSQLVQRRDVADCIKCGIWAATEIIQRSGCSFPPDLQYED